MTPAELRQAIANLGMTQVGFARMIGVAPQTVRRWIAGSRRIPGPVIALVDQMLVAGRAHSPLRRKRATTSTSSC